MRNTNLFLLIIALLTSGYSHAGFDSSDTNRAKTSLKILRITPAGDAVSHTRQIVVKFNQPMVSVGEMARKSSDIPIDIRPKVNCEWRWLNNHSLACQLSYSNQLKYSTRYSMTFKAGFTARSGQKLKPGYQHSFTTLRPKINYKRFETWLQPTVPRIQLTFNQKVSQISVTKHVYFRQGFRRYGVTVTPYRKSSKAAFSRYWIVEPIKPLPLNAKADLWVEPGLTSNQGPLKGAESRRVVRFYTFPEFKFVAIQCNDNKAKTIRITRPVSPSVLRRCSPHYSIQLQFTAPVQLKTLPGALSISPQADKWKDHEKAWKDWSGDQWQLRRAHNRNRNYSVDITNAIDAFKTYTLAISGKITDVFNRPLKQDSKIQFTTDHYRPSSSLANGISIMQFGSNPTLDFTLMNIDQMNLQYETITKQGRSQKLNKAFPMQKQWDESTALGVDLNGLLQQRSGIVVGQWTTTPFSSRSIPYYTRPYMFFAQLAPYHIHSKLGHFNSMAWVTDIQTGSAIRDSKLELILTSINGLGRHETVIATTTTDKLGIAKLPGWIEIVKHEKLKHFHRAGNYYYTNDALYLKASKGDHVTYVPLLRNFYLNTGRISQYKVYPSYRTQHGHAHAWGFTAQGVYKLGSTIDYKLFVRDQDNSGFTSAPSGTYTLTVYDPGNRKAEQRKNVQLSEFGTLHGKFTVGKTAMSGWYRFHLRHDQSSISWNAARVLVTDFKPAAFKVSNKVDKPLYRPDDTMKVTTNAKLHSGGPFADAQTRVTTTLHSASIPANDPKTSGFRFDNNHSYQIQLNQTVKRVDADGRLVHEFKIPVKPHYYGSIVTESSVRDPRGKWIATSTRSAYASRDRFIGLRMDQWLMKQNKKSELRFIVIDDEGKVAADAPVAVTIERRKVTIKKRKNSRGLEVNHYEYNWEQTGICKKKSSNQADHCDITPKQGGYYRFTASVLDSKQRMHKTVIHRWASGKNRIYWKPRKDLGVEMISDKKSYKTGDRVRVMIKSPFSKAKALVSIERYGVIDRWTQDISGNIATLQFKVKKSYVPGFYLSVSLINADGKPLISSKKPENKTAGKPGVRFGYIKLSAHGKHNKLVIKAKTDKTEYKPRGKVKLDIQVSTAGQSPAQTELAVVVLDESVFDLIQNGQDYFDVYKGINTLDTLDVANFNLLLRIVHMARPTVKRKMRLAQPAVVAAYGRSRGKKMDYDMAEKSRSAPAEDAVSIVDKKKEGGGGQKRKIKIRNLFKYLSYWNGNVRSDAQGKASVSFTAPDNLTGWRVLVIAVDKKDKMGLGQSRFTTSQPLELRPALPNQVTEGDNFEARFWVMNRTKKDRKVTVNLHATGKIKSEPNKPLQKSVTVTAKPFQRVLVGIPVSATQHGKIRFRATATSESLEDGTETEVPVHMRKSMEVAAHYGTTEKDSVSEIVKLPKNSRTDIGKIAISLSPSVIGNVDSAFRYVKKYPYMCWEQKLTKGVMASHYQNLKDYLPKDFEWQQSGELVKTTLRMARNHQAPNGGMTYYKPLNRHVSPYLSAYTALAFNWLRNSNHAVPTDVETKLHAYLLKIVRSDETPKFYNKGMNATMRAVILAALAPHGKITVDDLKKHHKLVHTMTLFGKSHYLLALTRVKGTESMQKQVIDLIRSSGNETAGKYVFSETIDAQYKQILYSSTRSQCAVLNSMLNYENKANVKATDIPFKLVRALTQSRGRKRLWNNTQENMFCMNALINYSRIYEKTPPKMVIKTLVDSKEIGSYEIKSVRTPSKTINRPLQAGDAGKDLKAELKRSGKGRFYYTTRLHYSPKVLKPNAINSGIEIKREYSVERNKQWVLLKSPMQLKQGELVRVDLFVKLPAARNFVIVDDAVPGGLEPVNTDLATASKVDAGKAKMAYAKGSFWYNQNAWRAFAYSHWSFYHREMLHHSVRYYSEYLPAGNYHLSYVAQAIAPGKFVALPTHAEEMYDPDVYGKSTPAQFNIAPRKQAH